MDDISRLRTPLSLAPMDVPSPATDTQRHISDAAVRGPAPESDAGKHVNDRFFGEATREFDEGLINQPLWLRVLAKHGGDKGAAKTAYLRARATELRLAQRDGHAEGASRGRALPTAEMVNVHAQPGTHAAPRDNERAAPERTRTKHRSVMVAAGLLAAIVVVWVIVAAWRPGESAQQPLAASALAPSAGSATAAQRASSRQASAAASKPNANEDVRPNFEAKVGELTREGNWNVLVLYASEWTRKEPSNAQAWHELSVGYAKLRQLSEAFDAATKAVHVAPRDPSLWRHLGQLNVAANEPADALRAFEQAVAVDEKDVYSFVQAGLLNVQLARFAQARTAFDKALAVSPDDVDALCGQLLVAQKEGRPKDADPFARQLKSLDARCADGNDRASETMAVRHPAAYTASPTRRR